MDAITDDFRKTVRSSRLQFLSQDPDYAREKEIWERQWKHFLDTQPREARTGALKLIDSINLLRLREAQDAFFFALLLGVAIGRRI